jgi:hypothetical protein
MTDRWDYVYAALLLRFVTNGGLHNRQLTIVEIEEDVLKSELGGYLRGADITRFIEIGERRELVTVTRTPFARPRIRLNHDKIAALQEVLGKDSSTVTGKYRQLGTHWLQESLATLAQQLPEDIKQEATSQSALGLVPASDRIVPLDHNSREVREIVVTIDDAIRELDGINDQSSIDKETLQHIFELKAGRAYLEGPQVDLSIVEKTLVHGLRQLATRTFNNSVDIAINAALAAVLLFFFGIML